jgi:5-methylcytosine-specific restriction endonuclease McrA
LERKSWKGGLNRTEYNKYRRSTKWGEWRKTVFERDDYTCQDCGIKGSQTGACLEPHHIIPMRVLIKNNLINLIYEVSNGKTLCRKCHMKTFKRK